MAKVQAFQIPGLELWFNTNDHLEPHFHAGPTSEDYEFRVFFLELEGKMLQPKWPSNASMPGKLKKQLVRRAASFRLELVTQWNQVVPEESQYPRRKG